MTTERHLEILFRKNIHHGYVRNAVLSPDLSRQVKNALHPGERCVVLVQDKGQRSLWFTNHRLLKQDGENIIELFPYDQVQQVHWMAKENRFQLPKREYFDRLVVDLGTGEVEIDGLDQAYLPVLQFLQFVAKTTAGD